MIDYHIDLERRLVITHASGRVTLTDLAVHLARLMRDAQFHSDFNALIVASDLMAMPSSTGVTTVAPLVRAWSKRRAGAKWAFVVPNKAARRDAEAALDGLKLTAVATKCFLSEADALGWLEPAPGALAPEPKPLADQAEESPSVRA